MAEDVIIAVERFLSIKESADNGAGCVLDGRMKNGFAISEPEVKRSVCLDFLTEIFTALPARMRSLDGDLATNGVCSFCFRNVRVSGYVFNLAGFFRAAQRHFGETQP